MVAKEFEAQKNALTEKEADEEKIRSRVMSLVKKDLPSPSHEIANASASSEASDTTQETTSTPVLNRIFRKAWK